MGEGRRVKSVRRKLAHEMPERHLCPPRPGDLAGSCGQAGNAPPGERQPTTPLCALTEQWETSSRFVTPSRWKHRHRMEAVTDRYPLTIRYGVSSPIKTTIHTASRFARGYQHQNRVGDERNVRCPLEESLRNCIKRRRHISLRIQKSILSTPYS